MLVPPQRILVLYCSDDPRGMRPSVRHHLYALEASNSGHRVVYHDMLDGSPSWMDCFAFDALVLHTTLLSMRWNHLYPHLRRELGWVKRLAAPKIALPQDEYDHSETLDEWLCELGVSAICTNFDEAHRKLLHPLMHDKATFYRCLTGYIDDRTARRLAPELFPTASRRLDIAYRAYRPLYWYGSQGQLKQHIADAVAAGAAKHGLRCDISTRNEDTLTSNRWFTLLASSKVTIGCETGSSVLSRRGEIQRQIQSLLRRTPDLSFDDLVSLMPAGWDDYRFCAIGPRHFEAIITKTCQVLVEGNYDGVLEPHRHYIPLKRDLSNLDEVLEKIRDPTLLEGTASRAYEEIYLSGKYSYAALAGIIERALMSTQRGAPCGKVWPARLPWWSLPFALRLWARWRLCISRAAKVFTCARVYLGEENLRWMLHCYVTERGVRKRVGRFQFFRELLRLGALLQARQRQDAPGECFEVSVRYDAEAGRVVLTSLPGRESHASARDEAARQEARMTREPDWGVLEAAFRQGQVRETVWDHWAVGKTASFPGPLARHRDFFLGEEGIYRLEAFTDIARGRPGGAIRLLKSIVAPSGTSG